MKSILNKGANGLARRLGFEIRSLRGLSDTPAPALTAVDALMPEEEAIPGLGQSFARPATSGSTCSARICSTGCRTSG
jgi:hypothetical protein